MVVMIAVNVISVRPWDWSASDNVAQILIGILLALAYASLIMIFWILRSLRRQGSSPEAKTRSRHWFPHDCYCGYIASFGFPVGLPLFFGFYTSSRASTA